MKLDNIKIILTNSIPKIVCNHKNNLNMIFIDYDNPNYLCFVKVINDKITIDKEIKSALNYNYEKLAFLYYDTLLKSILDSNITNCFSKILDKYKINKDNIFTIEHIEILRKIYDADGKIDKEIVVNHTDILEYWKEYSFVLYDNKKQEYKSKRKLNNFIFEFNSKFWIEKYKNIIFKNYLTNSFSKNFNFMLKELNLQLNKEKQYILS